MTILCTAYGLEITPSQCRDARAWFCLGKICGDCPGQNEASGPLPVLIIEPEFITPPSCSRVGGVPRSGPTIATALRQPSISRKTSKVHDLSSKNPKSNILSNNVTSLDVKSRNVMPHRPCPPDMTPAVARRLGLI